MKTILQRVVLVVLTVFSFLLESAGQTSSVSGRVTNDAKESIPGVSVQLKGTDIGTITDENGAYTLAISNEQSTLIFSYLGYATQEIGTDNRTSIDVVLIDDNKLLNEVVVTALGIKRADKSLGFAASTVTSAALVDAKTNNWVNSLSGKVAGLNIQGVGAGPMGSSRVTLRGESSLNLDNNQALIIVDGVPISSKITGTGFTSHLSQDSPVDYGSTVSDLNPDDIENVTVLKGAGSATNGVALSQDEKTLYIANADNNCLAVFDVSKKAKSQSKGFIPVGWYPTSVRVIGKKIFVANGKGFTSFANPLGPQPIATNVKSESHLGEAPARNSRLQYIGSLMKGTLSIIDQPKPKELALLSKKVYENTPYKKEKELNADGEVGNPIPMKVGDPSPIKYVFYVLKENRTYDQVFGDMPEGNGDKSLCLFGEKYTPNQHKLSREYTLFDNFYVDAEVSADGHNWSMGAHANDYLEKTWPTGYGRRGGVTEGMGRREIANNRDGFIWDFCKRKGVSYRTYGVFADDNKGNIPALDKDHVCSYFTGYYNQKIKDTTRVGQWRRDFDSLIAINAVPALNTIRLGADHTQGLSVGKPTPYACVADNDLAVGMLVEHISNSPIWEKSAIFVLEDDAQNGPDHVDAHRSTALVISPYTKRKNVDHTMYSTSGMLRTIELILGLPPMSQYDAGATPMYRSFTSNPDFSRYQSVPVDVDLDEVNKLASRWSKISDTFDFAEVDKNDDTLFNIVLWKGLKGDDFEVPAPRRSAFVRIIAEDED
jgi:hypothetical protein